MAPRILLGRSRMTRCRLVAGLVLVVSLTGACGGHLIYPSGPYRGRVIDADTGQPLAGAVVVARWFLEHPLAVHGTATAYDVDEVLTDDQGGFVIPRRTHATLVGSIQEPRFTIYALGYGPYPGFHRAPTGEAMETAFRDVTVVELVQGKTPKERSNYMGWALPMGVTEEQVPTLYRLINLESKSLGLPPIGKQESK
jgi:hypothetical protein